MPFTDADIEDLTASIELVDGRTPVISGQGGRTSHIVGAGRPLRQLFDGARWQTRLPDGTTIPTATLVFILGHRRAPVGPLMFRSGDPADHHLGNLVEKSALTEAEIAEIERRRLALIEAARQREADYEAALQAQAEAAAAARRAKDALFAADEAMAAHDAQRRAGAAQGGHEALDPVSDDPADEMGLHEASGPLDRLLADGKLPANPEAPTPLPRLGEELAHGQSYGVVHRSRKAALLERGARG